MREKSKLLIKTMKCIAILPLYYIIGNKNIFPYVLSLCLYNMFISSFSHITIKENLKKIKSNYAQKKLVKIILITISLISLIFILLSIITSDIINTILNINDTFLIFLFMGLSTMVEPILKILLEYIETTKSKKIPVIINILYYILDTIITIIIGIFVFRIYNIKTNTGIALLYLSKIISMLIILNLLYLVKGKNNQINIQKETYNYKLEVKKILTKKSHKSIINIIKNSYYYISIILLYLILSTRYGYAINEINKSISFIYFYGLTLMNFGIYLIKTIINKVFKEKTTIDYMYIYFKTTLTFSIILSIISPLICKVLFYDASYAIYLTMLIFLSIVVSLYNLTYEEIKNKKLIYISLTIGIVSKLILTIPLINSFYRVGYNLIYGDILSTTISISISIVINYIHIKSKSKNKEKYLEKILKTLYENILLCIILILFQFIIPIETSSYFKSIGLIILYLLISIIFIKIKNKKRG